MQSNAEWSPLIYLINIHKQRKLTQEMGTIYYGRLHVEYVGKLEPK